MSYQPIVELRTGKVLGSEGLARWHDVEFGEVTPNRFVGIAEITGLAPILDRWAVGRALSDARMLRRAGAIPLDAYVSVNLTTNNLTDRGLEELIVTTTISSGLAPANVMLEITEGAVLREADLAIALLRRLRARGFLLALDDFGTGHSSLAYLRDLPISVLKIDRSFVAGIREDSDALAIVASIVDLGRAVGVTVIAKGVESEEQARLLRELGCQAAQGWLWCQALPPADVLGGQTSFTGYDTRLPSEAGRPRRRTARTEVGTEHGLDRLLSMHRKGASLATIAASLNLDGYLTPKGLRWHQTSVARAVSDDAYPHLLTAPPT
jgi:EAL domain-containing protein (putative c-di-GMP-specific phosphodiesterase class I)